MNVQRLHHQSPKKKGEKGLTNYLVIYLLKISKIWQKIYKLIDEWTSSRINTKKSMPRFIIIKLDKVSIWKLRQWKSPESIGKIGWKLTYRGEPWWQQFSHHKHWRQEEAQFSKGWKKRTVTQNLLFWNISFRNEAKIKTFSEEG